MLEQISVKITGLFKKQMTMMETDELKMILGIETLLHQCLLFTAIAAASAALHIFKPAMLFFLIFGLFRLLAGGMHLSTSTGCIIVTTTMITGGTLIALRLTLKPVMTAALFAISLLIVLCCAPRRTSNYPVTKTEYNQLKIKSALYVLLCGGISLLVPHGIREIVSVAVLAEAFTLIPPMKH